MEWPMIALEKVAEIRGGATPNRNVATYWNGSIPWLTPSDLPRVGTGIATVEKTTDFISEKGLASSSASLLPAGTVLFSSRASIGKVGIATVPLTTNQGFANFIPEAEIQTRYLAWCLSFHANQIADLAGSTTFKEVTKRTLRSFRIPVPPLPEQRRIVDLLDQADLLRRLSAEADAKADCIVSALMMRVLGNPFTWEPGPHCQPLAGFVRPVSGATPSKKTGRFWAKDMPWVTPKDMKRDFLPDSQIHVSQAALDETNLKVVERGNVLIVVRGMILARDVPVAINLCLVTINQDMKALIPKTKKVTGSYVWAVLRLAKERMRELVRTAGHGTRKLDTPDLMRFSIPQPHAELLKQVESIVEHHRLVLKRRQERKRLIDRLFAVVLGKAFDGSLTSAWRETHLNELLQEMEHQASGDDS